MANPYDEFVANLSQSIPGVPRGGGYNMPPGYGGYNPNQGGGYNMPPGFGGGSQGGLVVRPGSFGNPSTMGVGPTSLFLHPGMGNRPQEPLIPLTNPMHPGGRPQEPMIHPRGPLQQVGGAQKPISIGGFQVQPQALIQSLQQAIKQNPQLQQTLGGFLNWLQQQMQGQASAPTGPQHNVPPLGL